MRQTSPRTPSAGRPEDGSSPATTAKFWAADGAEVARDLGVEPEVGLSDQEVERRLTQFGPNQLVEHESTSWFKILVRQLRSFVVYLLVAGAALSFVLGDAIEGLAIVAVIAINTTIGFVTELRALRSTEALRRLGGSETTVRRNGAVRRVQADAIVPGDVLLLEGGDSVCADARLFVASRVSVDESTLTGESVPVEKDTNTVIREAVLTDRTNMVYRGTAVTRGAAEAVVVATGMSTELGRIASMVQDVGDTRTPLEERIDGLGRVMGWICVALVLIVGALGVLSGKPSTEMIKTAIALAVATIPEGLPIVATLALARGVLRMAKQHALIEQLAAVETLGSASVILTDKTGTLTENRMQVTQVGVPSGGDRAPLVVALKPSEGAELTAQTGLTSLVEAAAFCTDASIGTDETGKEVLVGDPMELALLRAASNLGLERRALLERRPRIAEEAFDPDVKMMATAHEWEGHVRTFVKGAPEQVLNECRFVDSPTGATPISDETMATWRDTNVRLASEGLRLLAVAYRDSATPPETPYEDLTLLGLVALSDPPRGDVAEAIRHCHEAGVDVVMVTGDQAPTALSIATAVGITSADDGVLTGSELTAQLDGGERLDRLARVHVFARTNPAEKLKLLDFYRERGAVTAMIGDGVNDAPSLRRSDIGVAMGKRGTQVAREASDMILQDDRFATIVVAIREGRTIFRNIRSFVFYLLSCNLSEVITIGIAAALNAPLPILPLQILFLNLVTDVFPALALGMGESNDEVMQQPPRPKEEPLLARGHWMRIVGYGATISVGVLASLFISLTVLDARVPRAVTISFLTLAGAQLLHVFNMASLRSGLVFNEVTKNPWIWGATVLCLALLLSAVYVPLLSEVLSTVEPGPDGWALVAGFSCTPLVIGQLGRVIAKARLGRSSRRISAR